MLEYLLLEDGSKLLLEDGSGILLESSIIVAAFVGAAILGIAVSAMLMI